MNLPRFKRMHVLLFLLIAIPLSLILLILLANLLVARQARHVYHQPDELSARKVGLVLGTSKRTSLGPNPYFEHRIDAAVELYEQGLVEVLLVSGDNSIETYNEPQDMQDALVARGIPADQIYHDYAGFSTLDSVLRAQRVFGLDRFIVISQAFHCERAIFLARSHGIEAIGYAADDVQGVATTRIQLREYLARVKALLDILLRRGPKYLGDDPYGLGE